LRTIGTGRRPDHLLRTPALVALVVAASILPAAADPRHAIAMHGEPALAPGFPHFAYVNPQAPKGGRITHGIIGTFDSLNPFIVKGLAVPEIRGTVIESLMTRGYDEPFTLYGLLAQTIDTDEARSFVTFTIDPRARFSDGHPVTAQDVIFSWRVLREQGRPNFLAYYGKVAGAAALGERVVRFDLTGANDRELPMILGLMPILPQHAVDPATFEQTTLTPPIGSGPYRVDQVEPGSSVTLRRNPDYWGRDLAVNRGLWNFDEIRLDFYREANSQFEAFKTGLYDIRIETDPGRFETGYDIPAARDGRIVKEAFANGAPKPMSTLVFNTRRQVFADIRVREAILDLFDFEWINHNFFFDLYRRTTSYFDGSELSAHGRPADDSERALLARFPDAVRADVLAGTWSPPVTDGSGRDRATLKHAIGLLAEAGLDLANGVLRRRADRTPFGFEILVTTKDQERLALTFARDLERAGIAARVRLVDAVQFEQRRQTFDFDMIPFEWQQSLSPGNEQSFYWGSAAADAPGSRNYMGVRSAAIDALIAAMLDARSREDLVAAVRALDRVLISGFYVVPLFHLPAQWVARWTRIAHPQRTSNSGYLPETWWHQPPAP